MAVGPRLEQHPTEVVSLAGWEPDQDFPYAPQGAKPKRIFICPNPPPHRFLIGGHRYLFKEPSGVHLQQIWSEVIAYEVSRDLRLPVPPAFLALGPGNGSPGVLVEFFYGYREKPDQRFVHAKERLQGLRMPIDVYRGSLKDNITLCRLHRIPEWRVWWARTLAFDAIIGNTDRHSENWGLLIDPDVRGANFTMAPAFDNGTSLGYIIRDSDLSRFLAPGRLNALIAKGRHHVGWISGDDLGAHHSELCRLYAERIPGTRAAMDDALNLTDDRIGQLVDWCRSFIYAVPFTEERAMFVMAELKARRDALAAALEHR